MADTAQVMYGLFTDGSSVTSTPDGLHYRFRGLPAWIVWHHHGQVTSCGAPGPAGRPGPTCGPGDESTLEVVDPATGKAVAGYTFPSAT